MKNRKLTEHNILKTAYLKRGTAIAAAVIFGLTSLTACGNTSSTGSPEKNTSRAAGTSGSAEKSEKKYTGKDNTMDLGYLASTGHLLYFVAQEEGFFKDEGLNVTLHKFENGPGLLSALESNKLDAAAMGSPETTSYISQGHDISVIGGIMSEGHALVVKKDVVKGENKKQYYGNLNLLKGRTIAVAKDGTEDMIWQEALKHAGIKIGKGKNEVHFKYVDSGTSAYTATKSSSVDGALLFTPNHALAEKDGMVTLQYSGDVKGYDNHPCCRNVAQTEDIKADPDKYEAFLRALIKAYKFYRDNKDETVKDITKYVDVDPSIIKSETYNNWISMNPDPDKKSFETWKDTMEDLGYVKHFNLDKNFNTKLYKDALNEILKEYPNDKDYKYLKKHYSEYDEKA